MYNVMKAQMYQLLRSNSTYYAFIAGIGMCLLGCAFTIADGNSMQVSGSTWLILMSGSIQMLLPVMSLIFVVMVCGGDMGDKTINYEVLTGKRRIDVYLGRAVISLMTSLLCCLVSVVIPLLGVTAVQGWGNTMTVEDVSLRIAAMLFPMLRLTAFYVFIAFLFRNKAALAVAGCAVVLIEIMVSSFLEVFDPNILMSLFSVSAVESVFAVNNLGLDYIDGNDVWVVKDLLEMTTFRTVAISGLAGAVVFLVLGYLTFRKKDMN